MLVVASHWVAPVQFGISCAWVCGEEADWLHRVLSDRQHVYMVSHGIMQVDSTKLHEQHRNVRWYWCSWAYECKDMQVLHRAFWEKHICHNYTFSTYKLMKKQKYEHACPTKLVSITRPSSTELASMTKRKHHDKMQVLILSNLQSLERQLCLYERDWRRQGHSPYFEWPVDRTGINACIIV